MPVAGTTHLLLPDVPHPAPHKRSPAKGTKPGTKHREHQQPAKHQDQTFHAATSRVPSARAIHRLGGVCPAIFVLWDVH